MLLSNTIIPLGSRGILVISGHMIINTDVSAAVMLVLCTIIIIEFRYANIFEQMCAVI